MISYKERLNPITTFIFDVDGVLTTGEVIVTSNDLLRNLNSKDYYALQWAAKSGYRIFIITGGDSEDLKKTLLNVGVTEVYLHASDKLSVYEQIKKDYSISDQEVLYMGDDIPDYLVLLKVGMASCPQDAVMEIKQVCHYQSPHFGGKGCVRDVIEQTMRLHGKWFTAESMRW